MSASQSGAPRSALPRPDGPPPGDGPPDAPAARLPRSLRLPLPRAVLAALLLLLAVAAVALWTQRRAADASELRRHTLDVRLELAAFSSDLKDLSRAVRGYAISGQDDWLDPYRTARERLPEQLQRLQRLTAGNEAQQQRLRQLGPLLNGYLRYVSDALDTAERDGLEAARRRIAAGPRRTQADDIDLLLAELDAEELRQLALYERAAQRSTDLNTAVTLLGSLLSLTLMALAGRALQRKLRQLRANVDRLARARSAESQAMARLQQTQSSLYAANEALQAQADHLAELNDALWQWISTQPAAARPAGQAPGSALDDPQRLQALRRTGLMDSAPEHSFDRFTRLAAQSLQVPVSLICLVDAERQFFKSQCGLGEPLASARQTPLSHSLCQHVVTSGQALEVSDARTDPLLRDSGAVKDLGVVAYLGVPLATPDGQVLGSFCAMDHRPRRWSTQDRATLERIAQSVLAGIAVRMQLHELERRVAERTAEVQLLVGAIEHSLTGFSIVGLDGRFTFVNEAYARMAGYDSPQDVIGTSVSAHCADPSLSRRVGRQVHGQGSCRMDFTARRRDGSTFEALLDAHRAQDPGGREIHVGTVMDITERKRAEQALRMSEERLRLALDAGGMDAFELDPVSGVVLRIGSLQSALGLTAEEQHLLKAYLKRVHPQDRAALQAALAELSPQQPSYRAEYRIQSADGTWRWLLERSQQSFNAAGERGRITGVVVDVTERRHDEEAVKTSLAEKEVLLQEVHHRVKNNLQVVSSLLQLQRRQLSDPAIQAAFSETESRVRAMALVHQRLYQQSTLSSLDFADYLRSLGSQLLQSFGGERSVKVVYQLQPLKLPVGTAIPLGLIVTELITNALKYAFDRHGGVLGVELAPDGEWGLHLVVSDDGPGLPAGFEPLRSRGLGMRLVQTLSRQIDATVEFGENADGGGTRCRIRAPISRDAAQGGAI
ncbi:histidine kinase dimerization/phosphoacceptor domain -containing protein [Azohydromonas lata]|uniref:histidine kinase n=1 Tax=Azohydromonas lata TaxID=45677 RepID=A0ABU5IBY2_9BURK|nr:histidine kinase dimerization/phosphoacceptor domain -containing protein [Azohydromonas lata]MDZ5455478.1 histidine kinase dimerization/phosphoacceptor domain -containing protein [Azohydromonas lata]